MVVKYGLREDDMAFVTGCGWNAHCVIIKLRLKECEIGEIWPEILGIGVSDGMRKVMQ